MMFVQIAIHCANDAFNDGHHPPLSEGGPLFVAKFPELEHICTVYIK